METFLNSLPKPVLAALAIFVGIIVFMVISPPHTVCDAQEVTLRETQIGNIFPTIDKKNKIPPVLLRAIEACQVGNSAGSCYEYFMVLKKLADDLGKSSNQCLSQLYNVREVRSALREGIEMMVLLAWGEKAPELGVDKFGWFQESEMAIFCRLKRVYIQADGAESWSDLFKSIARNLPGDLAQSVSEPNQSLGVDSKMALAVFSEDEILNRSLFSLNCEMY